MSEKRRILLSTEASILNTGFSNYTWELCSRLWNSGKFDISEISSYLKPEDPRQFMIPWKHYFSEPAQEDTEGKKRYDNCRDPEFGLPTGQFGASVFDEIVLKSKVDLVLCSRDPWMERHVAKSQYRKNFKFIWLVPIDSDSTDEIYYKDIQSADYICSYSDYGIDRLIKESNGVLSLYPSGKVHPVALRGGVDPSIFKKMDKKEVRAKWGIPNDIPVFLIVMRNQKRKLILDIMDSFSLLKKKYAGTPEVDKSILIIHSSFPDNAQSFNYPRHVLRLSKQTWNSYYCDGLWKHVYATFLCQLCGAFFINTARCLLERPAQNNRIFVQCHRCGKMSAHTPNTSLGYAKEQMAELYNIADVLVQCSIAGADEIPVNESKSCGTPAIVSNSAALKEKFMYPNYEHLKNYEKFTGKKYNVHLGADGFPMEEQHEVETGTYRSFVGKDGKIKMMQLMKKYATDRDYREKKSEEALQCSKDNYNWDNIALEWEKIFETIPIHDRSKTWDAPIEVRRTPHVWKEQSTDEEFVTSCYNDILGRNPDTQGFNNWIESLKSGWSRKNVWEYFQNIVRTRNTSEIVRGQSMGIEPPSDFGVFNGQYRQIIKQEVFELDKDDKLRILYVVKETAGDNLLSSAVIAAIKRKYPESSIYIATLPQYQDIYKDNPNVRRVLPYSDNMMNYRDIEGFANHKGAFDIVYTPTVLTQHFPSWLHNGRQHLAETYANYCGVEINNNDLYIKCDEPKEDVLKAIIE